MATTRVLKKPAPFARIIEKGRPTSWAVGLPVAVIIVALIGLFAYFASKAMTYSQQLVEANQTLAQQQTTVDAAQKRLTAVEGDLSIANNPGKTTVLLQPAAKGETAWGSAVWGEVGGKGFLRLRAYGLKEPAQGQTYQAFFEGADKKPVLLGVLDPGPSGSAFVAGKDLPAAGNRVFVTLNPENAKQPAADAKPLMEASLQAPAKVAKDE